MALTQGDMVVYSKTGTTGKVVRILELEGKTWAELDSTGLLYDLNSLEPAVVSATEERKAKVGKGAKKGAGVDTKARKVGVEDLKDEGSLDSSAGVCGAG